MTTENNKNTQEELLVTTQPTPGLTLYAIMNDKNEIVSVNNRRVHLTRKEARAARNIYNRLNTKVVSGSFVLKTNWTPAR